MVVLSVSAEQIWDKMLKFESPKGGSKSSKNSPFKPKKKRLSDCLTPDRKTKMVSGLPVPTVPPYPIEYFEKNALCHTNRAFNVTEEFLSNPSAPSVPKRNQKNVGKSLSALTSCPSALAKREKNTYNERLVDENRDKEPVNKMSQERPPKTTSSDDAKREVIIGFDISKTAPHPKSHHQHPPNPNLSHQSHFRSMPDHLHQSLRYPDANKYFNTLGIPVLHPEHNSQRSLNFTGSFKYPSEASRFKLVPMPRVAYGSTNTMQNNARITSGTHSQLGQGTGSCNQSNRTITNGTLIAKADSLRSKKKQIANGLSASQNRIRRTDSENFPHGGPPPYPGLSGQKEENPKKPGPPRGGHHSLREPTCPAARSQLRGVPLWHSYRSTLFASPLSRNVHPHAHSNPQSSSSPNQATSNSKEILISSLSPPPRLPVKATEEGGEEATSTSTSNQILDSNQTQRIIPLYSKVQKPKKVASDNKHEAQTPKTQENPKPSTGDRFPPEGSTSSLPSSEKENDTQSVSVPSETSSGGSDPKSKLLKPDRKSSSGPPTHSHPLYEDILQFEDENPDRQVNFEVRIDYSRRNKYKILKWNKSRNQKEVVLETKPPDESPSKATEAAKEEVKVAQRNKVNSKLKEIGEMKSLKLGVVRVFKVGKWRFVALCCCGNTKRYVHQPGRIENYVPGFSTLSEKELRENPEADVKLEIKTKIEHVPVAPSVQRYGGGRMQMTHALKESGYESDSTLVFKKREDQRRQLGDTKKVYRQIQQGGEIPFSGLQKPAPPRPKDDFEVAYSDLPYNIPADFCPESSCGTASTYTMSPPPSRPSSATFGEKKRSSPSRSESAIPPPPRRLSSKWHPSLIKTKLLDKSLPPVPRSASAERVRETRALYSSWHREMVAKSREKLTVTSPTTCHPPIRRHVSPMADKLKKEVGNPKSFLLDRRAVSESRFTLQDKQFKEVTKAPLMRSTSAGGRVIETEVKKLNLKGSCDSRSKNPSKELTRTKSCTVKEKPPISSKRMCNSLERPSKSSTSTSIMSRSAGTSPARSVDDTKCKWSSYSDDKGRIIRHTVSSINKIKSQQSFHQWMEAPIKGERNYKSIHHTTCMASKPLATATPLKRTPTHRKEVSSHNKSSSKEADRKKRLEQSESFDTTHSNETGYSSMIDLSPSPVGDRHAATSRQKEFTKHSYKSIPNAGSSDRESRSLPSTLSRRYECRPHSAPALRTRCSAFFHERFEKWQKLSRGESLDRPSSQCSTRSNSPLRSLALVKRVSNSFRNIPKESSGSFANPFPRCRSLEALSPSPHTHPRRYKEYILELRNAVPKSDRLLQLQRLFDSLEKVHTLERSVSTLELSATDKKSSGVIGFETWKALRDQERKALEYKILLKQLDTAQQEKDFFYKANVEKKWAGDCRLQGREYCVANLKDKFDSHEEDPYSPAKTRRKEMEDAKDTYRGLWRGSSVKDLSKTISSVDHRRSKRGSSLSLTRDDSRYRTGGLWTSLSLEQINALREQLTEIYGSMQSVRGWRQKKEQNKLLEAKRSVANQGLNSKFIDAGKSISDAISNLHCRPLSVSALDEFNHQNIVQPKKSPSSIDKTEERKKRLSKQLSMELQEKVAEQRNFQDRHYYSSYDRPSSVSPDALSRTSPRTCYSLDISDSSEPTSLTSNIGDQFVLVVKRPQRSNSLPIEHLSDGESSDSDASVRTVIHKDVARKVKFFEKKARKNSKSSISSRGSYLNVDTSEVPHYATLPLRHKSRQQKKDILSSSYVPERSVSSVTLNQRFTELRNFEREREAPHSYSHSGLNVRTPNKAAADTSYSRSYLLHVKTGDVGKLKERYESHAEKRIRSKSLPDMGDTLARITPTDRIVVRGQEVGDVKFTKKKYESAQPNPDSHRWTPLRDEYLPKNQIVSTLSALATRSPSFHDPDTLERISRRESVEKSMLKRVHSGVVESVVDKFESCAKHDDVSILGQMYTSVPSLPELVRLSPLVPPRPPLPDNPPKKPLRSSSFSPNRLSKTSSVLHPLKTSTPSTSPQLDKVRCLSPNHSRELRNITPFVTMETELNPEKPHLFKTSTPYDAAAHVPKSRYTPPDSDGATKWTQSLERPRRLVKILSSRKEMDRGRAKSFSPPPRGPSSLQYGYPLSTSYSHLTYGSPDSAAYDFMAQERRYSRALSPPLQNYVPSRSSSSHLFPYQNRASIASSLSYQSGSNRVQSPPPCYSQRKDSLMLRQHQPREPRSTTRYSPRLRCSYPQSSDYKYELGAFHGSDFGTYPNYNTYPLNRNRSFGCFPNQRGHRSPLQPPEKESFLSSMQYRMTPTRPLSSTLSRDSSTKSVTFKEPVFGTLPYSSYSSQYGDSAYPDSSHKYKSSEVNIHYRTPVRVEHKEPLSEEELSRRQEEHMKKVYEQERRKKYLQELEDIERRRHTDYFSPLQKSPIPLNRYDDEPYGGMRGGKTPEPRQVARALFNFSAQNKRELSFNKGDVLTIRRTIDRNWQEGELRGIVGIFPSNYVEVIPLDSLRTTPRKPTEGQGRARFNFQAQTAMEMSLSKGELVVLTRRVDENWYEGKIGNRKGIFPVTYVDVLMEPGGNRPITPSHDPIPRPALPAAHLLYNGTTSGVSSPYSTTGRPGSQNENKAPFSQLTVNTQQEAISYRALYHYKPQNEDELELVEGDIVLVMEKCDDGWFVGTSKRTGLFGTFPGNYVERC